MPKNFTQKQIVIIGGAVLAVIVLGVVFFLSIRSGGGGAGAGVSLTVWGTDDSKAFNDLIQSYSGPGSGTSAQIKYVQIPAAQYRTRVLSALAAGTGPDIFEISNRDLAQWQNLTTPVPATLATTFNQVTLQSDFPDVVTQDFVSGGNIYALPLSIDTLAMIYNKDMFNTAVIAAVPTTWEGLQANLPQLRVETPQGQITQAALALGGSETSIPNAPDIIFLLMMQNGTQMTSVGGSTVKFASGANGNDTSGLNAFNYYLQFGNAAGSDYTWNDGMGTALSSFMQGKTAVIFDYSSALAQIKATSPFLNYGVAPMPQPANATVAVNYAKYNGLAVSRSSANIASAWNFIISLTTSAADENIYLKDAGTPPALRSVISSDFTIPTMSIFASQALTAKSWHEAQSETFDGIMNTAIQNVLSGAADPSTALNQAQSAMNGAGN